jgi:queuine/archaeosine tRNA-ribosyltransferase
VRELLGTNLLVEHNLHVYSSFFAAARSHLQRGTLSSFASWFVDTQTCEAPPEPTPGLVRKRQRHS